MMGEEYIKTKLNKYRNGLMAKIAPIMDSLTEIKEEVKKEAEAKSNNLKFDASDINTEAKDSSSTEELEQNRQNAVKNFTQEDEQDLLAAKEKARQTSMLHSQGQSDHSGSSYHGPGKPMSGKTNSNMWQRNFDNHQGN
jgi:hypothetical protein